MAHLSRSSLCEPSSEFPPTEDSLVRSDLPLRSRTDHREFMFVPVQANDPQAAKVRKQAKAFVSKNHYQRKKQASIDRLKPQPFPTRVSQNNKHTQEAANAHNGTLFQVRRQRRPSLTTCPSQHYGNPFSSYSMPMTATLSMYLHHYRVHVITSSYRSDAARGQNWWLQKVIASPALLQTCAFMAAGHKASLEASQGVSSQVIQKSIKDSIFFRIKAIKALNEVLQDPVTAAAESTVLLVNALMTMEALNAEFQALQPHIEGLKALISLMGGINTFDHLMLSALYQAVIFIAALYNSKPLLPMLDTYRDKVLQESNLFEQDIKYSCEIPITIASLGARFSKANAPWYEELHSAMKSLLKIFCRLIQHLELGTLFPTLIPPTDNDLFVIIQHQMLSINYKTNNCNLNEPSRLSLLLYLYVRVVRFGNLPLVEQIVEHLKQSLASATGFTYFQATAPDLLFWILFMGGMASQGYSSHAWFVERLAEVARGLGMKQWAGQVRPLLGEFFYTDQAGQSAGEDLWSEVVGLEGSWRFIAPKPGFSGMRMD
ncbi:hypothetical protein BDV12DRAFT_191576 [Aspergillus spectabilis]